MSNQKTIKKINRNRILSHIRNQGPISRWDISKQLGLSASAVSSSVSDLIDLNLIHEKGEGESSGGRRPILLDINSHGGLVIAVDIQSVSRQRSVHVAAVDLKGRIFKKIEFDITYTDNASFLDAIGNAIHRMMTHPVVELRRAISIGIATPGLVNTDTGEIVMHGRRIRNLQLGEGLSQRFGCPVVVHNNIDASAYGEYHFGVASGFKRVLFLRVGYGVGFGLILNGEIYHASPISAGEIGHMTIVPDGPICRCGNRGCLSVLVSAPIIIERIQKALDDGYEPTIALNLGADIELSLQSFLSAAQQGDPLCHSVIEEVSEWIGIAVSNCINLLAPDMVVLNSELFETSDIALNRVKAVIIKRSLNVFLQNTAIELSTLDSTAGLRGIAILALNQLLVT